MTVFLVRTYIVKPDKLREHDAWGRKLIALIKKQSKTFRAVKSVRVLSHRYGASVGGFTAMWKFDSLAEVEKWEDSFKTNKEQAALRAEFMELIVPGSYCANVWETVRALKRRKK